MNDKKLIQLPYIIPIVLQKCSELTACFWILSLIREFVLPETHIKTAAVKRLNFLIDSCQVTIDQLSKYCTSC